MVEFYTHTEAYRLLKNCDSATIFFFFEGPRLGRVKQLLCKAPSRELFGQVHSFSLAQSRPFGVLWVRAPFLSGKAWWPMHLVVRILNHFAEDSNETITTGPVRVVTMAYMEIQVIIPQLNG